MAVRRPFKRSAGAGDRGLARALVSDHGKEQLVRYQGQACTFIWDVVWWRQVCFGNDHNVQPCLVQLTGQKS